MWTWFKNSIEGEKTSILLIVVVLFLGLSAFFMHIHEAFFYSYLTNVLIGHSEAVRIIPLALMMVMYIACMLVSIFSLSELICRTRKRINNNSGYIIAEVMVAVVVITVALTALAAGYIQTTTSSMADRNLTYASYIAQKTVEGLKKYDGKKTSDVAIFPPQETSKQIVYSGVTFNINAESLTVANVQSITTIRPCQIKVSWSENGKSREIKMVSYYFLREG